MVSTEGTQGFKPCSSDKQIIDPSGHPCKDPRFPKEPEDETTKTGPF